MQVPCLKTLVFFFGFFVGFWPKGSKVKFVFLFLAHRADLLGEIFAIWRGVLVHVVGAVIVVVSVVWVVIVAFVIGVALRPIASWFGAVSCKVTRFLAVEACSLLHEGGAFVCFEDVDVHGIWVSFLSVIVLWSRVVVLSIWAVIGLDVPSVFERVGISANVFFESAESVVGLDGFFVPVLEVLWFVTKVDSFSDVICQRYFEFLDDIRFFLESGSGD